MRKIKNLDDFLKGMPAIVAKYGLPPSAEDLATWAKVSINFIYANGGVRVICAKAGIEYDLLPNTASQFENSVYSLLREFLPVDAIKYQYKFSDCRRTNALPFDFYIPSINLVIEADGTQHYRNGKPEWKYKIHDTDFIKNDYCKKNNIALLRIRYRRYHWRYASIKQLLADILLHAQETGRANCFNCWDGDKCFPISNQAIESRPRKEQAKIDIINNYAVYSRTSNKEEPLSIFLDKEDVDKISVYSLYIRKGTVNHSAHGLPFARTILNIPSDDKRYVMYLNGNKLDLRKSNLSLVTNAEFPRSRRLTVRSSTGIKGIYKTGGTVNGTRYYTITAISHGQTNRKVFSYKKFGGEEGAISSAVAWLNSIEGSTTISKESTPKPVEMGSTQTSNVVGNDIV